MRFIPVSAPAFIGNESLYVADCLQSTWISSKGKYIDGFETAFAEFLKVKHAITCSNGTTAIHLALLALGVGPGDEVIIPTLTYVATANSVTYCGARPVFVDSEPETWNINPALIESVITPRTKGIVVVHLYGHPVNMDPVLEIADKHGLFVVEDAAEAQGALYRQRPVGSLGDIGTFSFFGNKIITTGEGGMVVTNNDELAKRIRRLKGQGVDPERAYWHDIVGYNYRLTNLAAAIGLAQMEKIDWHILRRREIAAQYAGGLAHLSDIQFQPEKTWARNVYWMTSIVVGPKWNVSRDLVIKRLAEMGIETRPFFYPMHQLPIYQEHAGSQTFPVADRISSRGLNLPSFSLLTENDIKFVCTSLEKILERQTAIAV